MKKIAVTGATGFIGAALLKDLARRSGVEVLGLCRSLPADCPPGGVLQATGDLATADVIALLNGVDVLVHAAACTPAQQACSADYRRANVDISLNLARQAAVAGVKRLVFISSVKVNGESTTGRAAFSADDLPAPLDAYGQSKHEAEQALQVFCAKQGLELVIVRPPLVYGPGVKANFASLMRLCNLPFPLPFGSINNRRSMLYLANLVDFIALCTVHPAAAGQVFLVSDRHDLSLAELVAGMRTAMGRKPLLLPAPGWLFRLAGRLTGRQAVVERLLGDLQVDSSKVSDVLGWQPPFAPSEGLAATVAASQLEAVAVRSMPLLRVLDVLFALCGLVFGLPVLAAIYVLGLFDTGSPLFLQERVGRNKQPFTLVKFRTMRKDTASVASHLASATSITRMGKFLRKTKLDELPQLWNVLKGEMSLVGPRPNLYNQHELIAARDALGVYAVRPGITGLAQVNGIDMSTPQLLAETDAQMMDDLSLRAYFKYILQTVAGKGAGDRVG